MPFTTPTTFQGGLLPIAISRPTASAGGPNSLANRSSTMAMRALLCASAPVNSRSGQDASAHGSEIVRQHRNHHGILVRWTAVQLKWPAKEVGGIQREEFGGAGAANSRESPDARQRLLEIAETAVVLIGRTLQRDV